MGLSVSLLIFIKIYTLKPFVGNTTWKKTKELSLLMENKKIMVYYHL